MMRRMVDQRESHRVLRERVSKAGQGFNTFNDAKISGYYNTKSFDFTGGLSVRGW